MLRWADSATVAGGLVGDYFHNYPHLGLDILYDSMHRASKVILKANALGYYAMQLIFSIPFRELC